MIPWNKGLTKETDKRIEKYSLSLTGKRDNFIPWNKNKKYKQTEEARLNIKNAVIKRNKQLIESLGYVHSPEVRNKIKINNIGKKHSLKIKGKTYEEYYGKEKAKELKLNISIKNKGRIKNIKGKTFEEYYGNTKAKTIKQNISDGLKEYIKNNKPKHYSISEMEKYFGKQIEKIFKVKLKHSFYIENKCYDYKIINKNILIECDGTYWHSLSKNIENDKYKDELAVKHNYKLYRFNIGRKKDVDKFINENYNKLKRIFI